ncbi:MAG: DUF1330 domain-containing protein [Rhodospirillaceae bacterium]|jgi:uncharacterized protein (DUF1330 family)|nr:DUF1330 domain-containing protein [Rhodospirillaceae bacterium]MBT6137124.1 DUF1330 domain-containing protein [Rhodospirillaceae bacterium]
MPKALIIVQLDVHDMDTYKTYTAQTPGVVESFGGRFVVRGGRWETIEGDPPRSRVVVLEFPSFDRAKEFYNSPEYQKILPIRLGASTGSAYLVEAAE